MLSDSNRIEHKDKKIDADVSDVNLMNQLFVRLVAKGKRFTNVDFKYTIFDTCYLRNCIFDTCDFTGCRFVGTSLYGSSFTGCKFDYATFEKTMVDSDILDTGCPALENLKMRFARSLKVNYQQLGDTQSVNKAVSVELQATEVHLSKAWRSNDFYYRKKYAGWRRIKAFLEWANFKALDLIWGNGESVLKLIFACLVFLLIISFIDAVSFKDPTNVESYWQAMKEAPQIFLGVLSPKYYSGLYLAFIVFVRLITMGFFLSIIIKRFNRR